MLNIYRHPARVLMLVAAGTRADRQPVATAASGRARLCLLEPGLRGTAP
jgi:hypothetical protein